MVQLSHPYMTTGKTTALTRWTFVGKVMSLLFNYAARLVIAFCPRSKRLLISRLQSPSTVILEPKKIKSLTASIVSPSICNEVMGLEILILFFPSLLMLRHLAGKYETEKSNSLLPESDENLSSCFFALLFSSGTIFLLSMGKSPYQQSKLFTIWFFLTSHVSLSACVHPHTSQADSVTVS